MPQVMHGVLDDVLPTLRIGDFSGGINTMEGALSLSSNETPDCQNVIGFPGRLLYVGGTNNVTALPVGLNNGDGGIQFYDSNNAKHIIVWADGNMYDTVNGTRTLINSSIYTAGQNIGRTILNSILYWSTLTTAMRSYDGTTEAPVVSSGAAGAVAIPKSDYLCTYAGSIIAANPTIGSTKNPGSIIPSNTNDPTTFIGANQSNLGNNNVMQALVPMSVSAGGIPPTSSVMCVGSVGLVLAQGAINALKLQNVNYPIGCRDGNSVSYIPTGDLLGNVIYLGNDNQLHESNGITTKMLTSKILNLINKFITDSLTANPNQRFSSTYNSRYHYYLLDTGGDIQLAYKWTMMPDGSTRAGFFKINGWPSGMYFAGTSGVGFPTNYVVVNGSDAPGMYEVGVDGDNFNGVQPNVYYNTPLLHANDPSMMKEWQWFNIAFNNSTQTDYTVDSTGLTDASNTQITGNQITLKAPVNTGAAGSGAIWDIDKWDVGLWASSASSITQSPTIGSKMLTGSAKDALGNTVNMPLRSSAMSYKIAWKALNTNSVATFDITNISTRYKPMGHYMTGGATGSAEAN